MREFLRDLKFGGRLLFKGRVVTAIVVATLALGIGVTSTIVSLVGAVLVHPFPAVKEPDRIGWFFETRGDSQSADSEIEMVPVANFLRWKEQTTRFATIAALMPARRTVEGGGEPERVKGFAVSANYFHLMGTSMAVGRDFSPDEDTQGHDRVAILGHAFAERRFGGSAAAVGQTFSVQGIPRTVVGVLPPSFAFPGLTDLWIPLVIEPSMRTDPEARLIAFGRLKRDVTVAAANAEIAALAPGLAAEFPDVNRGKSARILTLPEVFIGRVRPIAVLTLVAALLTLVVAATNVGNILFAQGTARRSEIALRAALGASRGRLARQLLTECLVLCALGGAIGVLLSMWGLDLFIATMPERVAHRMRIYWDLRFDLGWVAVATGLTFAATLVAGLLPAWRLSETTVAEAFKEQSNQATSGRGQRRILKMLVTGQVAIALALLTGAAWGGLDLLEAERYKLGFEPKPVLVGLVSRDAKESTLFFADLVRSLRALPGVTSVGLASVPPLDRGSEQVTIAVPGRPPAPAGEEPFSKLVVVDADYFATVGTTVFEGRLFIATDTSEAPAVAVLSRRTANRFLPGEPALGKTLLLGAKKIPCTIVGIVDDIAAYHHEEVGMVYRPLAQAPSDEMFLLLRGTSDPSALDLPMRDAVHALDRTQPVEMVMPLKIHIDEYMWPKRTTVRLIAIPAGLAMLLALLGIYGVTAYSVTQRRSELGIRAALGASPRALVALVMREALWIAAVGATIGLGLSFLLVTALTRATQAGMLSLGWTAALGAVLFVIVLVASYGPARRAARTSPSLAIRSS